MEISPYSSAYSDLIFCVFMEAERKRKYILLLINDFVFHFNNTVLCQNPEWIISHKLIFEIMNLML